MIQKINSLEPGMVAVTFNTSTQKAETGSHCEFKASMDNGIVISKPGKACLKIKQTKALDPGQKWSGAPAFQFSLQYRFVEPVKPLKS